MKKIQFKFLVPILGLALMLSFSMLSAKDSGTDTKPGIENIISSDALHLSPTELENVEHYKLDDAEYKSAVATKSSFGGFSYFVTFGLIAAIVAVFTGLLRSFRQHFTKQNLFFGCITLALVLVALYQPSMAPGVFAFTLPAGVTLDQFIKGLKEERAAKASRMQKMLDLAQTEKRDLKEEELKSYNTLKSERFALKEQLELAEEAFIEERGKPSKRIGEESEQEYSNEIQFMKRVKEDRSKPLSDWYLRNFDVDPEIQKANVYKVMRSLATGKASDKATSKALDEMRSFSGSAILNPFLSAQLWEGSLSKSRLAAAGLKTIPLESNQHKFAQIETYPTFEWKAESAETTERTVSLVNKQFTSKTLRGWFNVPAETLNYASNADQVLRAVATMAASNEIDRAGLIGSGIGAEPEGVLNYTNLNTYSLGANGGSIETNKIIKFLEVVKLIHDDNEETPTAAIMNPREWKAINQLVDLDNNPLGIPPALKDIVWYQTTKVPTNLDAGTATGVASAIIFGGFEQLYLGIGMDVQVQVLPIEKATGEYPFFLSFMGDFLPQNETAFGALTDVIPS